MDKLLAQDPSWKNLKTELNISDAFVVENKSNIQKFIYEGGAEIMTSFLNRQPKKKEEIRRIVNAELLGKFMELKYHGGDLEREIAFPIKRDTEEIWKEKLLRVDCKKIIFIKHNSNDLERLWLSLCPEFECKGNSVRYVERVG